MIKLQCKKCKFTFEVSEKEFLDYPDAYKECYVSCGGENEVVNLEEIVNDDIYDRAEEYLNEYIRTLGLEGAIELCERHREEAVGRIYIELLRKRGLIK